jgi:hypothetical protein
MNAASVGIVVADAALDGGHRQIRALSPMSAKAVSARSATRRRTLAWLHAY